MSAADPVPMVDLGAQHAEVADEVEAGFARVIESAAFVGGAEVTDFEHDFACFSGRRACVGVASGTDALELGLRVADLDLGAEVILPANTFVATAEAVVRAGLVPVLADVDPVHLLLDVESVTPRIGSRTAALLPVHLHGQLAPMEDLERVAADHGLVVVEDAAQAHGARRHQQTAGSWSTLVATSFYPSKNLGTYGNGGAVLTDDVELAARVRRLARHGGEDHDVVGTTSCLDGLQAVVLRAKLRRLDAWNDARRRAADRYGELLDDVDGVELPTVAPGNEHVWHLYVVRVEDRDRVRARLEEAGVVTGIHYRRPVHLTPAFAGLADGVGSFPVAEAAAGAILSLPMHPHLTADQQERVAAALLEAVA